MKSVVANLARTPAYRAQGVGARFDVVQRRLDQPLERVHLPAGEVHVDVVPANGHDVA
jgi:hypothetical protein